MIGISVLFFLSLLVRWRNTRKSIRVAIFEDQLTIINHDFEKSILFQDLEEYKKGLKKIKLKTKYKDSISIDKRDFDANELKEFQTTLETVINYWFKNKSKH